MLERIDIEGFRGIRECESPIKLSDFTVLVGRNNSGKSSLLEALYCVRTGRDPLYGYDHEQFVKRLHSGKNLAHRYSGKAKLEYIYGDEKGTTEVSNNISHSKFVKGVPADAIFYPSSDEFIDQAYSNLQNQRSGIEENEAHVRVANFLNKSIGDHYTEIYLETLEARKKPDSGNPYWVDIKDLGSGLVQTIPLFLAIEYHKPWMFLWDDMGTSLHPGLLKRVLKWLADSEPQIVLSTHSIDILSSLLDVRPDGASILQLSKTQDDLLKHTRLSLDELEMMMDNAGHDPRYLAEAMEI